MSGCCQGAGVLERRPVRHNCRAAGHHRTGEAEQHTTQLELQLTCTGQSDITESMVTIRSPFCGCNTTSCTELKGKDWTCYSNRIKLVSLRKCPYDHWFANKAYLSCTTVTDTSQNSTHKMAAKINWHRYGTKLSHCDIMYIIMNDYDTFILFKNYEVQK